MIKVHLSRKHNINNDGTDDIDRNIIHHYYTEIEKYSLQCKICNKILISDYNTFNLLNCLVGKTNHVRLNPI